MEAEKFKMKDIGMGLVIPVIVGLIIVAFPAIIRPLLDSAFPPPDMVTGAAGHSLAFLTVIFTHGFAQMVVFAIPVVLGLTWNKWAGGAAGFIMGTLYYVAYSGYYVASNAQNFLQFVIADPSSAKSLLPNLYADPSFIGNYIVGGILVGYIAGSLNGGSFNFKRMLGAGLTASITVGVLQFVFNISVAFSAWMTAGDPLNAAFLTMLPMILLGIIAPVVAKVMTWYGAYPQRHA